MSNKTSTIYTHIPAPDVPDAKTIQKQRFIMNALDRGWTVKKQHNKYILSKRHNGQKEVFMSDYLEKIIDEMI